MWFPRTVQTTTLRPHSSPGDTADAPARGGVRTDIQALRAVAVSLVLVYHLLPHGLTGGFVGVDVFFVISGFLITAHLLSSPPRRVADLFQFWSRRIRRLLPASLLVLAVALLVTRLQASQALWLDTAQQVRAAALYALNWNLAGEHVDYLNPAKPPTAVQHYWSLSVEEQFYLGWPILLALLFLIGRRSGRRGIVLVVGGVAAVVLASLAWSIHQTIANPAAAYFQTPTRIWELGIGGLLAAVLSARGRRLLHHAGARIALAWAGLAAIAWTALTYTDATPFPGWRALVPVLGAVAVLAAEAPRGAGSPARLMAFRPVQYLGDVSYSVYLWHWPLIILLPAVVGRPKGPVLDVVIAVGAVVLAGLTKVLVEDPFRRPRWGRPLLKPFGLAAAAMALVVGGAQWQAHDILGHQQASERKVQAAIEHKLPCFGAAALAPGADCVVETRSGPLTPTPAEASREHSDAWTPQAHSVNCFAHPAPFEVVTCHYGDPHAKVSIALVGNSHAAEWIPTVRSIAAKHDWQVTTYVAVACAFVDNVRQAFPDPDAADGCEAWNRSVMKRVQQGDYDLVVVTNLRLYEAADVPSDQSQQRFEQGYERTFRALRAPGLPVAVIRDTPFAGTSRSACLSAHPHHYEACDGTRRAWLRAPELQQAVHALQDPGVHDIDMTPYLCPTQRCPAAIGHVPVYFDNSHISRAYALTLAPYLEPQLLQALA
jgi:peptidoglycan/LPS O-acetylase OafA/YrhL